MKLRPDCYAANRSHQLYCQKCSGSLTNRMAKAYPDLNIKKKVNRRKPTGFLSLF